MSDKDSNGEQPKAKTLLEKSKELRERLLNNPQPDDGIFWALSHKSGEYLKAGRERRPSKQWRCCRCGAGFVLPIEPEKVPVPWWYYEAMEAGGWKHSRKNPVPWSCPECGDCSYTVPT